MRSARHLPLQGRKKGHPDRRRPKQNPAGRGTGGVRHVGSDRIRPARCGGSVPYTIARSAWACAWCAPCPAVRLVVVLEVIAVPFQVRGRVGVRRGIPLAQLTSLRCRRSRCSRAAGRRFSRYSDPAGSPRRKRRPVRADLQRDRGRAARLPVRAPGREGRAQGAHFRARPALTLENRVRPYFLLQALTFSSWSDTQAWSYWPAPIVPLSKISRSATHLKDSSNTSRV